MKAGKSKKQTPESVQFDKCQKEAKWNQGVMVNVDPDTHEITFDIRTKKELYRWEVEFMFNRLTEGFGRKMDVFEQAEKGGTAVVGQEQKYIDEQIEYYKYLIGEIKWKDLKHKPSVPHHFLSAFREIYQKRVVNPSPAPDYNIKIGSYIKSQTFNAPTPNDIITTIVPATGTDPYHIEVEAHAKYFNWLKELGNAVEVKAPRKSRKPKNDDSETPPSKLVEVFKSVSKYSHIMDLLVEHNYCMPITYIWIDHSGGSMSFLAALLKYLQFQGYYKKNKRLKNEQIKEIALNTFGYDIGIDTIKKASPNKIGGLYFIPPASTIN